MTSSKVWQNVSSHWDTESKRAAILPGMWEANWWTVCVWIFLRAIVWAHVYADVAAPRRRSEAWDWVVSHKHLAADLYIPFFFRWPPLPFFPSAYHFLCASSLQSLRHIFAFPFSPSPSHFPSIRCLFSTVTCSIPHSIFSACPLSFFADLIICFFLLSHSGALETHFCKKKVSPEFRQKLRSVHPYSNARCHGAAVQLFCDLLHN